MHTQIEQMIAKLLDALARGVAQGYSPSEPLGPGPVVWSDRPLDFDTVGLSPLRPTHFECTVEFPIAHFDHAQEQGTGVVPSIANLTLWGGFDAQGAPYVDGTQLSEIPADITDPHNPSQP